MNKSRVGLFAWKILVLFLSIVISYGIICASVPRTVEAAASQKFSWTYKRSDNDGGNWKITVSGYANGKTVKLKLTFPHEASIDIWDKFHYKKSNVRDDDQSCYITFTSNGGTQTIEGAASGMDICKGTTTVKRESGVTATPKPATTKPTTKKPSATTPKATTSKATTKQTSATKKKTTSKKKSVKKSSSDKKTPKKRVVKKSIKKIAATSNASETTAENKPLVPVVVGGDNTIPSNTDPTEGDINPVSASLNHNNMEKSKKSFAWLWFVLLLIVAGLSYLRVRSLKNQGKQGKDLVLDFIPGVGDLVYAFAGSSTKYEPIASDTQHGYMRNTAASKKELKMLEEQEKRAEQAASKPVTMHKRPKELSVNHAAVTAAPASEPATASAGKTVAAAAVAAGGITSQNDEAKRPASPFKPMEGAVPVAKPASPFKPATQQNNNGQIMTSAFKPSTGAHNPSDKIVSSAFKPSAGAHNPSDKIVSSALKQTQKFTPQKGPAQVTHSDNDAVKLARERAEAAREQQAMREAMKAQKTAPAAPAAAAKAEAKPHAPIKRPSAFSVNRAAAIAAGTVEATKPANTASAAPAVQKTSGASLGVGASAAAASKSGPVISPARAKASSNSNQLGNLLNGRANNSGRAPVWASPNTAVISPFKQSAEALEEAKAEEAREAERRAAMEAEAPKTSYADQAKTHKSAFFSRNSAAKDSQSSADSAANAYGGIVRPTGVMSEGERKQQIQNAAMGSVLEGQKPAILDPDAHKAPTAVEPVFGFKPIDPENYGT